MPVCAVCSSPAFHKCAACKSVSYCSPAHQKEDWKAHKGQCGKALTCTQSQAYTLEVETLLAQRVAAATEAMRLELEKVKRGGVEREVALKLELKAQLKVAGVERGVALDNLRGELSGQLVERGVALDKLRGELSGQLVEAEKKTKAGAEAILALDAGKVQREAERVALEDLFLCCSCTLVMVEPVTIPCGHNHCISCITSWVAANPTSPTCPVCRGVFVPPLEWCVNKGLADALAANNGPGFKEHRDAYTLTFHSQLLLDTPGAALLTLVSVAGGAKCEVDLAKELRLPGGTLTPPLYYILEKKTDDWTKLAMEMIRRGCDINSGVGALDQCGSDFPMAQLLLAKGATKCTSAAVKTFSRFNLTWWTSDYKAADDLLLALLPLLPQPLSKVDDNLQVCLFYSLQLGHKKTALVLLEGEIPFKEGLFTAFKPIHFAASSRSLDAVKLIHARDPTAISSVSTAASQTPLHLACLKGRAEVAMFLIEQGCGANEENKRDNFGNTALVCAGQWARSGGGNKAMKEVEDKLKLAQGY